MKAAYNGPDTHSTYTLEVLARMFERLKPLPADPILGLIGTYMADTNPNKIDLGAGVYKTAQGLTPVLDCVREAELHIAATQQSKSYVAPPGDSGFIESLQQIAFGRDCAALHEGRIASVQAPGGCGALRLGGELLQRVRAGTTVWVSAPTWANHIPLLGDAGVTIREYPYYDQQTHQVQFDQMMSVLGDAAPGDVVLLHGCCHNPCGADLNAAQWETLAALCNEKDLLPFIDIAYHGLGDGLDADAAGLRLMAARVPQMLVAYSCSKNFGLYRDRAGLISVLGKNAEQVRIVVSQMNSIARGMWSMPPAHGASVVAHILDDEKLSQAWVNELTVMRERLNETRALIVSALQAAAPEHDFEFIARERGMFSFMGVTPEQVARLREQYSVYLVDSSRISVAGINPDNVDHFAGAVAGVLN